MAPSLLFIPDISGFTKFVNNTAVEHGRHIIAELLDLIIESDELGLTVSEVEGDAVFFYRDGPLPSFDEIVAQSRRMFEAFHRHLKSYEVRRICDCGACEGANDLTLKIVVHAGPIELLSVRGFEKPFGTDVIVAHRLLKNDLDQSEYLLVTDAALQATEDVRSPGWSELGDGAAQVDDVGVVPYRWLSLSPLRASIPDPEPIPPLEKSSRPLTQEIHVDRPAEEVFELIMNLDQRLLWNRGVEKIEYDPDRVNRIGTWHRCVVDGNLIDFETVTNDFGEGRMVYGERLPGNPLVDDHVNYFIVESEGAGSRVSLEVHYRPRAFPRSFLAPLVRLRLGRLAPVILGAIKEAAESLGAAAEPMPAQPLSAAAVGV